MGSRRRKTVPKQSGIKASGFSQSALMFREAKGRIASTLGERYLDHRQGLASVSSHSNSLQLATNPTTPGLCFPGSLI